MTFTELFEDCAMGLAVAWMLGVISMLIGGMM